MIRYLYLATQGLVIATALQGKTVKMFCLNREIKAVTHLPNAVSVIKTGQRLAQCNFTSKEKTRNRVKVVKGGEPGSGSSDFYRIQDIGLQQPELTMFINGKKNFSGFMDMVQIFLLQLLVHGLQGGLIWRLLHSYNGLTKLKILNKIAMSFTGEMKKTKKEFFAIHCSPLGRFGD